MVVKTNNEDPARRRFGSPVGVGTRTDTQPALTAADDDTALRSATK
jgi:hypothetical protein